MCIASAVGFILLTVAFLACGVGFVAQHWVYFPADFVDKSGLDQVRGLVQKVFGAGGRLEYEGMLGRCYATPPDSNCIWFWHNDFEMEKEIKGRLLYLQLLLDVCERRRYRYHIAGVSRSCIVFLIAYLCNECSIVLQNYKVEQFDKPICER